MALVVLRLLATLACPIRLRLVALGRQWCCRVAFTLLLFAFNRSHPDVDIYGPWVQETLCHFVSCTPLLLGPTYAPPKCGPMPPSRELIALQNSTCLLPQGQDSSARPCSL